MTQIDVENFEPQIIKTQDESGEIHEFELIDIVSIDDISYGLLIYVDEKKASEENEEEEEEEEEEEVVVMRLSKEDDQFTFEAIEDEEEFNRVLELLQAEALDEEENEK